ncbi:ATP-binding protein [Dyadobacter sp. CY261]|uniref:ATP-binding protein n=1 Tax=Dyadobacter sp. CY261 TaxID=2907203 RepID=UPI001F341BDC|nr:ATP-binding protein [Dyadobacter sp. CY261]MCF0072895.1 ATP-binding protein [Dyadobacter sp. CY261]
MKHILLLVALATSPHIFAQIASRPLHAVWEQSVPFISKYTPDDYKAAMQNWALVQSDNGIIYTANNFGVLEFDGSRWKLIKTTEGNPVRSLAKDASGRIYVGGSGEIGYLAPNGRNEMVFHSLKNKINRAYHDFGNVWFTFANRNSVYFVCDLHILEWSGGRFKVWRSGIGTLGFAWMIRDELYVGVSEVGLMKMGPDSLKQAPGGAQFNGMGLSALLPYGKSSMLAMGQSKQFYLYDGQSLKPFTTEHGVVGIADAVYHGALLSNGLYALATTGTGLYLMDSSGHIRSNVSRKEGLTSDAVYYVFEDAEKDLWLATDNGISRLEINSPVRVLNENNGLDENPFDIEYFNDKIYAVNSKGLFQLNQFASNGASKYRFQKIPGIDNLTMHCQAIGNQLVVSNYDGIFVLGTNGRLDHVAKENVVRTEEYHGETPPGHLFVGLEGLGLTELIYTDGKWKPGKKRMDFKGYAENFARGRGGNLFVNTRRNGIYELTWKDGPNTLSENFTVIHHDTSTGLSSNKIRAMERVGNTVYASTDEAAFRYEVQKRRFQKDSKLTAVMRRYQGAWINEIVEGGGGKMWFTLYDNSRSPVFQYDNGQIHELPVSGRFSDALITKIHDTGKGIVFLGSNKWIALFNEQWQNEPLPGFKTLIRQVFIKKDSLIEFRQGAGAQMSLPFGQDVLRFQFALPSYDLSAKNQFQYYLEGFDKGWSAWSPEAFADFTNLPEGDYIFRVRGKNVYGETGAEDQLAFTVLPPWYRAWWAYACYALAIAGLTILFIRFRERNLQNEKLALEKIVRERTEKILVQTEELKEMDRIKSRFFANLSHEFRTPLTLILTPLEEQIKKTPPAEREGLLIMKRYASRLAELVNQLLNLSRLEAGKMELRIRQGDLAQFLYILATSFESLAQHKQIKFTNNQDLHGHSFWFDADKLEKIVINLLSNAFKFTPSRGEVVFSAYMIEKEDRNWLQIKVSDTGQGIAPGEQERIFESFYQSRQTVEDHQGGTGLGLALVKELVNLHHGHIALQSEVGKGTTFTVALAVDREAYSPDQIVDLPMEEFSAETANAVNEMATEVLAENPEKEVQYPEQRDSILIVEDNPELRNYMAKQLESEFTVYTAADGTAGLDEAKRMMPGLIISDLMMPGLDGMELTSRVKSDERTSHIPVILLTAKGGQESRIDGLKTGADDYLIKPFSMEELSVRVRNLILLRKRLADKYRERIRVHVTSSEEMSIDDRFLLKAKEIVEANMEDVSFSVEKMSEEMSLSRTQLLRKLKALTGLAPNDFIRDLRLQKAAELIRQKADTITQIGYAVGFNDQSYFSKCFKKEFGETPTEYSIRVSQEKN